MDDDLSSLRFLQLLLENTDHVLESCKDDTDLHIYVNATLLLKSTRKSWTDYLPKRLAATRELLTYLADLEMGNGALWTSSRGRNAKTLVRPCIAIDMMMWADPMLRFKQHDIIISSQAHAVTAGKRRLQDGAENVEDLACKRSKTH